MRRVSIKKPQMTDADVARVNAIDALFDAIDKNGDGKVSKRELKAALKASDHEVASRLGLKRVKDVDAWMKSADVDGDGAIDRLEFHAKVERVAPL